MLPLLVMTLGLAQAEPPNLSSGADLQAWRSMGTEATPEELSAFLERYSHSPLAELAVRQLSAKGLSIPTANIKPVIESVLNHDARLSAGPISVAIAPVSLEPTHPSQRPASPEAPVAAAE